MADKKPTPDSQKSDKKDLDAPDCVVLEKEVNGFADLGLPEPTRYNDWEVNGRCSDF